MHNYKVGDKVEILGRKVSGYHRYSPESPDGVAFMDYYDSLPTESESVWTPVKIIKVINSSLLVAWKDDNHAWRVEGDKIPLFIRPLNSAQEAASSGMATSCVECHTTFMYPVEHNCDQGRLCYGCRTTKAWKYSNLRG